MTIRQIQDLLGAEVLNPVKNPDLEIHSGCGADMVSDVIAWVKEEPVLLTGLVSPGMIRAAELLDIPLVVFVRGKKPSPAMVELATQAGIALMSTGLTLYIACGKLYQAGIVQSGVREN